MNNIILKPIYLTHTIYPTQFLPFHLKIICYKDKEKYIDNLLLFENHYYIYNNLFSYIAKNIVHLQKDSIEDCQIFINYLKSINTPNIYNIHNLLNNTHVSISDLPKEH